MDIYISETINYPENLDCPDGRFIFLIIIKQKAQTLLSRSFRQI